MGTHEHTFVYPSDRVAEVLNLGWCPKVSVTVSYTVYNAPNYDTPFGSDTKPAIGFACVTDLSSEDHGIGDLLKLRDTDDDFATEVIRQLDLHEADLLEHAKSEGEV